MNRTKLFVISIGYLIVILVVGLIFFVRRDWLFFLMPAPNSSGSTPSFGPMPVGLPSFGALGAVLISLTGFLSTSMTGIKTCGHGIWYVH